MNQKVCFSIFSLFFLFSVNTFAGIYSFEDRKIPNGWSIDKGKMSASASRYKLGSASLGIEWKAGAVITIQDSKDLKEASMSNAGGLTTWIYNEQPVRDSIIFSFCDESGKEVCRLPFFMDFKGWRCIWARFRADMYLSPKVQIHSMRMVMPNMVKKGKVYLDYFEFSQNVSWQKMSDAQYKVNQKDYSLIHNFIKYRNTYPDLSEVTISDVDRVGVDKINKRLRQWYLGSGENLSHSLMDIRRGEEKKYIDKGLRLAEDIQVKYNKDGTPIGEGLFPLYAPSVIDGMQVRSFPSINKFVLLPLALDYCKNGSTESLNKALYIYDWFNDQGWADGSGMGTLCLEKLRSSGYFHSFYLLKDKLSEQQLQRELKTMKWLTLFGMCYDKPTHTGEVADNLRALAIPKLIYALSLTDEIERQAALQAYAAYMDNALNFGPGFFGTIKSDYSGYHHRGAYNSAYYSHALYAGSLAAYLLHDTPFALSENSLNNLKQALLTFQFFSANLSVPQATTGRFPEKQEILHEILPAFVYTALSFEKEDKDLIAAYKYILQNNPVKVNEFVADVNSDLSYTSSLGETELMVVGLENNVQEKAPKTGSLFMPYSGLLVVKNEEYHFNIKGYGKYIWDFESSSNENLYGRYNSYGQIEYFNLSNGLGSYDPSFDFSYFPGTTVKAMPSEMLIAKKNGKMLHRNFSDETFLSGIGISEKLAMFSVKLHDIKFDTSFRANKSVFIFDDVLLCLGSDIRNEDKDYPTVTTLFQIPKGQAKVANSSTVLTDHAGLLYVVKGDKPQVVDKGNFTVAYLNHSFSPNNGQYHYYILPEKNNHMKELLLSSNTPIDVIQQDGKAHIVHHKSLGVTYAAIFDEQQELNTTLVKKVNIPLSFILETKENGEYVLSLCEPDMRRVSVASMDQLTEEDVLQKERPFSTEFILLGTHAVEGKKGEVSVRHENGNTIVGLSTIRGENYSFTIRKK